MKSGRNRSGKRRKKTKNRMCAVVARCIMHSAVYFFPYLIAPVRYPFKYLATRDLVSLFRERFRKSTSRNSSRRVPDDGSEGPAHGGYARRPISTFPARDVIKRGAPFPPPSARNSISARPASTVARRSREARSLISLVPENRLLRLAVLIARSENPIANSPREPIDQDSPLRRGKEFRDDASYRRPLTRRWRIDRRAKLDASTQGRQRLPRLVL